MIAAYMCCKNCLDRHPLCHSECEKKAAADAEKEAIKQAINEKLPIKAYSRDKKLRNENKKAMHKKRGKKEL